MKEVNLTQSVMFPDVLRKKSIEDCQSCAIWKVLSVLIAEAYIISSSFV